MDNVERLLYFAGVAADYTDYSGNHCIIPKMDRLRILDACGFDLTSEQAIEQALYELDALPWTRWLKPHYIVGNTTAEIIFHCHPDEFKRSLSWRILFENGDERSGVVIPEAYDETGEYWLEGIRYSARRLSPGIIEPGYHQLIMTHQGRSEEAQLIACPNQCFDFPDSGRKLWGITCQLYTLRSPRNWGIGDFADLDELITLASGRGADMIGLNPLHAPCSDSPDQASPYSPSDRRFLNALYIAPDLVVGYNRIRPSLLHEELDYTSPQIAALRSPSHVDHDSVAKFKYQIFEKLYHNFCHVPEVDQTDFVVFREHGGQALIDFSYYECRHNPYAERYRNEPDFFVFLQWLAASQFQDCQQLAVEAGMQIGLVGDLAVGAVFSGCEVESNRDLYAETATIGAPPDPFSTVGQDWGLPVINPVRLQQNGFKAFIQLLQANMAHTGALRIDHVMSLMRLWWCLPETEQGPSTGVYVYYPLREMLALVRLESHRNQCLVIGEDLGVVPPAIRQAMAESHIYGNNLFYFDQNHNQEFILPEEHRQNTLLMITNHDVPTLADWWNMSDLQRRRELNLIQEESTFRHERELREKDKKALLRWLNHSGFLSLGWREQNDANPFDDELCLAIHCCNAHSAATMVLLQLEDLQLLETPVNIPGTHREYPNWRRKQAIQTTDIFALPLANNIFMCMADSRP